MSFVRFVRFVRGGYNACAGGRLRANALFEIDRLLTIRLPLHARRYTRIKIPSIAAELNIPEVDVEALLVSLILNSKIQGHFDQVR